MQQKYDADELGDIEALLSFAMCFGARPRSVTYVSTPITTGRHYLHWRSSVQWDESNADLDRLERQHVVSRNLETASQVVSEMRSRFTGLVIDPTQLTVPHWNQRHQQHLYHKLWATFIERFATRVVFVDGWEYSTGCAIELVSAFKNRIPTYTQGLQELDPRSSLKFLNAAIQDYLDVNLRVDDLQRSVQDIEQIANDIDSTVA